MGDICKNKCWCEFCSKPIEKGEKYLVIYKQAQKGRVRINICKKCLIKTFLELKLKPNEISLIRKELMLEKLKNDK